MYNAVFARNAYGETDRTQSAPRQIEYRVFAGITGRIARAATEGPAGFGVLAEALHDNRRLWNTLAVDLVHSGNGLPEVLRARLLSLAAFIHRQTAKILDGRIGPAGSAVLVDINTAVMRGLCNALPGGAEEEGAGPGSTGPGSAGPGSAGPGSAGPGAGRCPA
jgi:flagellar protein FlaF